MKFLQQTTNRSFMQQLLKLLACFLTLTMLFTATVSTAYAAQVSDRSADTDTHTVDTDTYTATTSAVLEAGYGSTKKLVIDSYLTNDETTQVDIKPCDIIFVLDQSKWMNTMDDAGAQREAILDAMKNLLSTLSAPTTGGEHRVAIAGYGRVNVGDGIDPYDASLYPGSRLNSSSISFNTGYYTTRGFISQNGWSEVSDFSSTALPQMPRGYLTGESYDDVFLSVSDASDVLEPDTFLAWYAGASRMDAGLTIAEQLAAIANNHDTNNDRNLIVCLISSSLPIQNVPGSDVGIIRDDAVIAASQKLKDAGATVFAFGDYHASGRIISGNLQDNEENFTAVMQQVCSEPSYYFPLSGYTRVRDALGDLITQITITSAGNAAQEYTVKAENFVCNTETAIPGTVDENGQKTITVKEIYDHYYDRDTQMLLDTSIASVELYNFTGYDSDGAPTFSIEPFLSHEVALSSLVNSDQDRLEYTTTMIPLPVPPSDSVSAASDGQEPADGSDAGDSNAVHTADQYYGYKVVITISSPVTITYDWAERSAAYAPSRQPLPQAETIVLGTAHTAPTVTTIDEHYRFGSWYLDQACTNAYAGETTPISSYTLYGKWNRYVLINYFWNMWEDDYNYPDVEEQEVIGQIPNVYTPTGVEGYTFSGWYIDPELTTPYTPAALYSDIELYAKWISDSDSDAGNPSGTYPPSTKPSITIPSVTKPTDIKPSDGSQALDSNTPTDGIADAGSSSSGESGVGDKKPSTASSGSNSGPSTQPDASAQGASPKTEDRASLPLWILLLCLSGVVLYAGFHFHGRTQGRG